MTTEIVEYATEALMKADKAIKRTQGFRPIHVDYINNDKEQGFRVTYNDTPTTVDPRFERIAVLRAKLVNGDITFTELVEFLGKVMG